MSGTPKQNFTSRLYNYWRSIKNSRPVAFGIGVGLSINTLASFSFNLLEFIRITGSQSKLQYEGWVVVKINGFGQVSYDNNFLESFYSPYSLSRTSKITTLIYTDALPSIDQINSGDVKDGDISVLTNLDWEGKLADNDSYKYTKINSQAFQSQLVSIKESKKSVCLYVGGVRNGKKSSYLNILKIKISTKNSERIKSNSQSDNDVRSVCGLQRSEPILKRVDR